MEQVAVLLLAVETHRFLLQHQLAAELVQQLAQPMVLQADQVEAAVMVRGAMYLLLVALELRCKAIVVVVGSTVVLLVAHLLAVAVAVLELRELMDIHITALLFPESVALDYLAHTQVQRFITQAAVVVELVELVVQVAGVQVHLAQPIQVVEVVLAGLRQTAVQAL